MASSAYTAFKAATLDGFTRGKGVDREEQSKVEP